MNVAKGLRARTRFLGAIFLLLFAVVLVAVVVQSLELNDAREDYQSSTYPITDLANTQRQAERLRSSVISANPALIELDLGLYKRQIAVTLAPPHRAELHSETALSIRTQTDLLEGLVEAHGIDGLLADPALYLRLRDRMDEVSRVAKEGYDREEQQFFATMIAGVDHSSQLATSLVVLGALTLVVGVAFALQLFQRARQTLAEANDQLREQIAERVEGERLLEEAYREARRSELRARAAVGELETLHQVVMAGVGGGADEVCSRVAAELVELHGFSAIAVALVGQDGNPHVAAVAGGQPSSPLLEVDGPTSRVLARAPAQQVDAGTGISTILDDAAIVQVAPINVGSRLLGALVVESRSPEPHAHLEAIQRLADQLGLLLEAARAFDDQRDLAERFRELDELKTEFVATVSHELRTPLTAIVGMALTLDQYWERVDEAERRDMVARMRRQARRQQRLVDDLLTISHIQQKGIVLRPEPVPLADVVRAVGRDLETDLLLDLDPSLRAWADRDHIERILTNYLTNAAKYAADARVRVAARIDDEGRVELFVADEGPGVPPDFRGRLFEAFTQASIGSTRTAQGVGLGLSIVRTLAVANGGTAWFRPNEPRGSIFGVTLPGVAVCASVGGPTRVWTGA